MGPKRGCHRVALHKLASWSLAQGNGSHLEIAGEDRLDDAAEYHLSTTSLRKSHPEDKDEFESVVEREPVNGVNGAFENRQEGIRNPILWRKIGQVLSRE